MIRDVEEVVRLDSAHRPGAAIRQLRLDRSPAVGEHHARCPDAHRRRHGAVARDRRRGTAKAAEAAAGLRPPARPPLAARRGERPRHRNRHRRARRRSPRDRHRLPAPRRRQGRPRRGHGRGDAVCPPHRLDQRHAVAHRRRTPGARHGPRRARWVHRPPLGPARARRGRDPHHHTPSAAQSTICDVVHLSNGIAKLAGFGPLIAEIDGPIEATSSPACRSRPPTCTRSVRNSPIDADRAGTVPLTNVERRTLNAATVPPLPIAIRPPDKSTATT